MKLIYIHLICQSLAKMLEVQELALRNQPGMQNYCGSYSVDPNFYQKYPSFSRTCQRGHQTHMTYLQACPSNIEPTRKKTTIQLLNGLKTGIKQRIIMISPAIYQGVLFPNLFQLIPSLVSLRSDRNPTIGVAIPSHSCPASKAIEAASVLTTVLRKNRRQLNQHAAVRSFKKCPIPQAQICRLVSPSNVCYLSVFMICDYCVCSDCDSMIINSSNQLRVELQDIIVIKNVGLIGNDGSWRCMFEHIVFGFGSVSFIMMKYYQLIVMQKIHRRKNQQIVKDYLCTEGCGKAYGSYAALYTHIKNKHSSIKPPQMKVGVFKKTTGKKGRPPVKDKQELQQASEPSIQYDCKICQEEDCVCNDDNNNEDVEKTLGLMADQTFIKLVNSIGQLSLAQSFSWIRNTQQEFDYVTMDRVRQMCELFNRKHNYSNDLQLSVRWTEYLSFSSRFWDRKYIKQLYNSIFTILINDTNEPESLLTSSEFDNMRRCCQSKPTQFNQFKQIIKLI